MALTGLTYDEKTFAKLDKLIRRMPADVLVDTAIDAGVVAMEAPLRVAKQASYKFGDRTGRLRRSIRTSKRRKKSKLIRHAAAGYDFAAAFLVAGGRGAKQAFLVHQGHGGPRAARGRPFMTDALLDTKEQIYETYIRQASKSSVLPAKVTRLAILLALPR